MRRLHILSACALLAGGASCAQSLSTFQPAHVAPKGTVSAAAGFDLAIPTGSIARAIDAGKTLARAADDRALTGAERGRLLDAGVQLALDPPAVVSHFLIAYVPVEKVEVSLQFSSGAWRVGGRYQILTLASDGVDLTVGAGVQRFAYDFPVQDVLDYVHVDGFRRYSVDVPVLVGTRSDYHRLWGGPKVVFSRFHAGFLESLPTVDGTAPQPVQADVDGTSVYIGAQGGVAVGFRHLFIGIELSVARAIAEARLSLASETRTIDIGGWVIFPGIALMGEL